MSDADQRGGPSRAFARHNDHAILREAFQKGWRQALDGSVDEHPVEEPEAGQKREGVASHDLHIRETEAGEALGFLPGDLHEKLTPYLRPLYDALHDMLPGEEIEKHMERGIIEVAPLAYMRGRTLVVSLHGKSVEIGAFLPAGERESFAEALRSALARVREPA